MSLLISGDLRLAQTYTRPDDADAVAYIAAVEAADGQVLETATSMAINSFVKGCKNDGIWPAIKASCILAGARTLTGALVPLAGTAPTNFNFISGDYDRKTGLKGNGSTKFLNCNFAENAVAQDNVHAACYVGEAFGAAKYVVHGTDNSSATGLYRSTVNVIAYSRSPAQGAQAASSTGFAGVTRSLTASFSGRVFGTAATTVATSNASNSTNFFAFSSATLTSGRGDGRLAFYSIGESLDLALLDARVTDLINAFAAAIP